MAIQREPVTYDQFVGVSLMNAARLKGKTQAQLAEFFGVSERTFTRRMRGEPGFTVRELEAMCGFIDANPGRVLDDALTAFGGIDKLLSEVRAKNVTPDDDAGVLDNVTELSQRESKGVDQERQAALRGKEETEQ